MKTIYSAEIVEPSVRHERRIRVTNRLTGDKYFRPFRERCDNSVTDAGIDKSLREKVREIHTSPFLSISILWYDPALEMLFFEISRRNNDGNPTSGE